MISLFNACMGSGSNPFFCFKWVTLLEKIDSMTFPKLRVAGRSCSKVMLVFWVYFFYFFANLQSSKACTCSPVGASESRKSGAKFYLVWMELALLQLAGHCCGCRLRLIPKWTEADVSRDTCSASDSSSTDCFMSRVAALRENTHTTQPPGMLLS